MEKKGMEKEKGGEGSGKRRKWRKRGRKKR